MIQDFNSRQSRIHLHYSQRSWESHTFLHDFSVRVRGEITTLFRVASWLPFSPIVEAGAYERRTEQREKKKKEHCISAAKLPYSGPRLRLGSEMPLEDLRQADIANVQTRPAEECDRGMSGNCSTRNRVSRSERAWHKNSDMAQKYCHFLPIVPDISRLFGVCAILHSYRVPYHSNIATAGRPSLWKQGLQTADLTHVPIMQEVMVFYPIMAHAISRCSMSALPTSCPPDTSRSKRCTIP